MTKQVKVEDCVIVPVPIVPKNRLNGLAMLAIHKNITIDPEEVNKAKELGLKEIVALTTGGQVKNACTVFDRTSNITMCVGLAHMLKSLQLYSNVDDYKVELSGMALKIIMLNFGVS
ncbi:hypothetical protein ACI65C_007048 [Semiaphis heraclei]